MYSEEMGYVAFPNIFMCEGAVETWLYGSLQTFRRSRQSFHPQQGTTSTCHCLHFFDLSLRHLHLGYRLLKGERILRWKTKIIAVLAAQRKHAFAGGRSFPRQQQDACETPTCWVMVMDLADGGALFDDII
jgi:hypothetical protein